MSFSLLLNFEKIAIEIIETELAKMTDKNLLAEKDEDGIEILDEKQFIENLYHGSIVATFIVNIYESALNTILSRRLDCTEIEILKTSHNVKLQLICAMYHADYASIKGDNAYSLLQTIVRVRNDITHYKNNELGYGHEITSDARIPMGFSKDPLAKIFTKSFMEKHYTGVWAVLHLICEKCGLVLNRDCEVIDCDGRDDLCEFILEKHESADYSLLDEELVYA